MNRGQKQLTEREATIVRHAIVSVSIERDADGAATGGRMGHARLGRMFGVTGQAISQVLSGKNSPSHTLAKAVAKARGYKSPEDLYLSGGTTSVAPPQKRKHWETAATSSYSQVGSDDEPFDPETPDDDDTWEPFAAIPVQFNGTLGVVWYWKRER